MNTLMIVNSDAPYDRRVIKEAKTLKENNIFVAVVYPSKVKKSDFIKNEILFIPIYLGKYYNSFVRFPLFWKRIIKNKNQILSKFNSEKLFIHSHDINTLPISYIISFQTNASLIYDSHELSIGVFSLVNSKVKKKIWWLLESHFIKKCYAVITVNFFIARFLRRFHKLKETPKVVYNSSDINLKKEIIMSQFIKKIKKPFIVYHGGLMKGRNLELIIKILPLIPELSLVFLGKGEEKKNLIKYSELLQVKNRVFFIDWVIPDKIPNIISFADIGISVISDNCMNNHLSSPNKIFDFVVLKIPQICSDIPVMKKIIEKKGLGLCVNEKNTKEFAQKVKQLLYNEVLKRKIKENLEKEFEKYLWDSQKSILINIYKRDIRWF